MHKNDKDLSDAIILITGGTGSFGRCFVKQTLAMNRAKKIIIFSRDEMKHWEMAQELGADPRVRFFLGDVRDKDRLYRACDGVDFIVHAAAMKIIPSAEYNPFECIKTNVLGAMNVIDCAIDQKVPRVVALSTDKACNPVNLYGATKLCSDKLFVSGNAYARRDATRFSVVRYGNVMGSRGSVIPYFLSMRDKRKFPITDERMTRFMITLDQAVHLVWLALLESNGGEIFVKRIPSMRVVDIAKAINPHAVFDNIGIRPGEKLHEQMISVEDARHTLAFADHYRILPELDFQKESAAPPCDGVPCPEGFEYSSHLNDLWMDIGSLQAWLFANYTHSVSENKQSNALLDSSTVPPTLFTSNLGESMGALELSDEASKILQSTMKKISAAEIE